MIIRILSNGTSFKGAANYLTHDPNAQTAERVSWTHTKNLANDHVPSAVDEMVWTARDAELLKQEAGVRAGGRATETPVKHLSLNWAPDEQPTREHMIKTTEKFLQEMKWNEHQAILVSHSDRPYQHVHVLLNVIHPETGLRLDDGFERRRAQAWALNYEQEQGRIYCEQRLKSASEREDAMPRPAWMAFRESEAEFSRAEKAHEKINEPISVDNDKLRKNSEWKILKTLQQDERQQFFTEGKSEFKELRSSIYREVREEFRPQWAEYYTAQKEGGDVEHLMTLKAEIIAEQHAVLGERRDAACKELRHARDDRYQELLDHQREIRAGLRERNNTGQDSTEFLQHAKAAGQDLRDDYQSAAAETLRPDHASNDRTEKVADTENQQETPTCGGGRNEDVGPRFGFSLGSFADALFFNLMGSTPAPRHIERDAAGRDLLDIAAEEATKQREHHKREEADEEWRRRQQPL